MGPLALVGKEKRETAKLFADEARKEQLHKIKVATALAKAEKDGIPVTKVLAQNKAPLAPSKPTNPEAGPGDKVPALLTPGEAVIPAPVAQNPAYKGIIEGLVQKGREMNDYIRSMTPPLGSGMAESARQAISGRQKQIDSTVDNATRGFQSGTTKVKDPTMAERAAEAIRQLFPTPPLGSGAAAQARQKVSGRQKQIDDAVDKAVKGYQDGTTGVTLTDEDVVRRESGGNPLARNPNSSATGLYQMVDAARKDVEKRRPELKGSDFRKPEVQLEYRNTYKDILAERLKADGIEPTPDNINRAWVVGPAGFKKVAAADPNAPLEKILGPKVTSINPNLQGKTAGQFIADPDPYSRSGGTQSVVVPLAGDGTRPMTEAEEAAAARAAVTGQWGRRGARQRGQPEPNLGPLVPPNPPIPEGRTPPNRVVQGETFTGNNPDVIRSAIPAPANVPNTPLPRTEVTSAPIPTVDASTIPYVQRVEDDNQQLPAPVAARLENLDRANADASTQEALARLQASPPPPGVDPTKWLADGFAKIYGPTGLFNERELLKFAVLAAGGVMTGVPTGRAIRYAGNQAMASAENRYNQQVQAETAQRAAESADERRRRLEMERLRAQSAIERDKDSRERLQTLETDFNRYLSEAVPEVHGKAQELFVAARQAKTFQEREAAYQAGIQLLAQNPRPKGTENRAVSVKSFINEDDGLPVLGYTDPKGNFFIRDKQTGDYLPAPKGTSLIEPSEFDRRNKEIENSVVKRLTEKLDRRDSKGKPVVQGFDPKQRAESLAVEALRLRETMGFNIPPRQFASIVENAVDLIGEEINSGKSRVDQINAEGFRRIVYGNAVIETRKASSDLYKTKDEKGNAKRPGVEAIAAFGDAIQGAERIPGMQGRSKAEIISKLEEQYQTMPADKKKVYEAQAKARPGYTPFLLWVTGGSQPQ